MGHRSELDLVLVNPGGRTQVYQGLADELTAVEPPVWAGLMATFARRHGLRVDVIDANALELDAEDTAAEVAALRPALTAVVAYGHQPSASTQVMPAAGAVCRALKEAQPDLRVALAGGHVAALPERTLLEESADFVCTGEGLHTLVELALAIGAGHTNWSDVPGLCYRDGDQVVRNAPAPLVADLDAWLPEVAWDLLPMERYRAHNWHCFGGQDRRPYAAVYTSLGCPYRCTFCCIQAPFKEGEAAAGYRSAVNTYRKWSSASILSQIDRLAGIYNVQNIKVADEMFVLDRNHVESICDGLIERDYDLNIWAYGRVDTIKKGLPEKLKRAGFNWIALGIEAADAEVRHDVQKGYRQEDIESAVDRLRDAGINVIANYIFGLPEDDHASMQATLDLALKLNCEFANFYCTMAYPGSPLYDQAKDQGWPLPPTWSAYSQHSIDTLPLPTRHVSATDVLTFRDEAFQTYFSNPSYLSMLRDKFGPATVQHVRDMAAQPLKRNLVSAA